jgi:hypothetical protein
MSDEQITPALLRADAAELRQAVKQFLDPWHHAPLYHRAAAALEEKAERLEQGERVCRWVKTYPPAYDHDPVWWGACEVEMQFDVGSPIDNNVRFCPSCGGRVVLGDEEASDE